MNAFLSYLWFKDLDNSAEVLRSFSIRLLCIRNCMQCSLFLSN